METRDVQDSTSDTNPPSSAIPMPGAAPPLSTVGREDLLADFGHQLRNQLNAIVMAASMLSAIATTSEQPHLSSGPESRPTRLPSPLAALPDTSLIPNPD